MIIIDLHTIGVLCILFLVAKFAYDFYKAYTFVPEDRQRKPPPLPKKDAAG
jgi:hypothetical protein